MESGEPQRPRIGYALGGGAARGAAHLGFLSVFRDAGIEPDVIAGTSIGALVGAGYAAGLSPEEMSATVRSAGRHDLATIGRRHGLSLFDTTRISQWYAQSLGDLCFEDLRIPLAAVACDVITGREIVLCEGPLVSAVAASTAIPGLFTPVERGDMLLVDGGVVDSLPVGVARAMGADIVIAVDVVPVRNGHRPHSVLDVIMESVDIATSNSRLASREQADYLVLPDVADFSPWDLSVVADAEQAGRDAALQVVDRVVDGLGSLSSR